MNEAIVCSRTRFLYFRSSSDSHRMSSIRSVIYLFALWSSVLSFLLDLGVMVHRGVVAQVQ